MNKDREGTGWETNGKNCLKEGTERWTVERSTQKDREGEGEGMKRDGEGR